MNRSNIIHLLDTTEPFLAKVRDLRKTGRTDEDAMLVRQLASKLILVSALVRTRLISNTETEGADLFAAAHALFAEGYYIGPSNAYDLNIDGAFMVCAHIDGAPEHEHRGYFATGDNLADLIVGAFDHMMAANECSARVVEQPVPTASPITSKEYRVYHSVEFATALKAFQTELGVPARHQIVMCDPMPSSYPVSVRFTRTATAAGIRIQLTMMDYTPDGENKPHPPAKVEQPGVIQKTRDKKIVTGRNPHTYEVDDKEAYGTAVIQYHRRVGLNPPIAGRVVNFPPSEFPARVRFSLLDKPNHIAVQCEVLKQGRPAPTEHHDVCKKARNGTLPCDCGMEREDTP